MTTQTTKQALTCDVLIAGGGVSGLFAGWRLLQNYPTLKVIIAEKQGWCGGRLETTKVNIKGNDGLTYEVKDEEGGMRFVKEGTGMENLWKLIGDLGLTTVPFNMKDGNNRYYFRGRSFTVADAQDNKIWKTIYNLAANEQDKAPTDILMEVMDAILLQNTASDITPPPIPDSPDGWIKFRNTYKYKGPNMEEGVVINKWGFWALLRTYGLTAECIEWLSRVIGFMGPLEANINAGEALQILFDFPAAPSFQTLQDGYQQLPDTLANLFTKAGGSIMYNTEVLDVSQNNNQNIVNARDTKNKVSLLFNSKSVVLALPRKALSSIVENSKILSANNQFVEAVKSVRNMELTKVGLYFNERWWHNDGLNISFGPSFNDLPIGTVYSFMQYPDQPERDKDYYGPAALTIYNDFIRGNFWQEIQNVGPKYQYPGYTNPAGSYPASEALVNEAMAQIKMLYGLAPDANVPMPVLSTYRVWGQGEFGYGYHQYQLNVDDMIVYQNIWNPAKQIFVCNEAWSPEQGWVEGSLISTDYVLVNGFKLQPFVPTEEKEPEAYVGDVAVKKAMV